MVKKIANKILHLNSGPESYNFFSCTTQLSMTFIMLINVKMPTIFGNLTFMSIINTISESFLPPLLYYPRLTLSSPLSSLENLQYTHPLYTSY